MALQALFQKYVEDIDFVRSRIAEDEAIGEFNRQRDHLEKQVAALKQQLSKSLDGSKSDIRKIMDVSTGLTCVKVEAKLRLQIDIAQLKKLK